MQEGAAEDVLVTRRAKRVPRLSLMGTFACFDLSVARELA